MQISIAKHYFFIWKTETRTALCNFLKTRSSQNFKSIILTKIQLYLLLNVMLTSAVVQGKYYNIIINLVQEIIADSKALEI